MVDVLDNPDARTTFDMHFRYDASLSLCTPTPLLCFCGDATPLDGLEIPLVVSRHSAGFINNVNFEQYGNTRDEAWAYLLAATLKKLEGEGLVDGSRRSKAERSSICSADVDEKFEIVAFRRDGGSDHRYAFMFRSRNGKAVSFSDSRELKKSLRAMIREDYIASFPDANADSLIVDFPEFSLHGGVISGQSVVLSLSVESLRYNSSTRTGIMRVRIGENQLAEARQFARRNIESLVRDKNIAIAAHDIPPAATFYLLDEKADGHVLEITFKTE